MGFLNYSRGYTFKNINFAYGAFGFAGSTSYDSSFYGEENEIEGFDGKGIFDGGLRTSIGYYDNAGNAEFRILSWENALSFENGKNKVFLKNEVQPIEIEEATFIETPLILNNHDF